MDGSGRAIGFALAPGQANELPMAPVLLSFLTAVALWIVADRGYSSHAFRMLIWSLGSRPAIPTCQVAEHCWDPVGHAVVRYGYLFEGLSQARQRKV